VSDTQKLAAALRQAAEALDSVKGNVNPERGFCDELEAEVSAALDAARAALGSSDPLPEVRDVLVVTAEEVRGHAGRTGLPMSEAKREVVRMKGMAAVAISRDLGELKEALVWMLERMTP
jgi:hypothetical protein